MTCFSPLKAYRAPEGGLTFKPKGSEGPLEVSCGQCRGCRAKRIRDWTLRILHEAQMHEKNSFVTLTYSPSKLPADGGLNVKHFQDFAKRLRKAVGKFRYFHCGEYGDENLRPHYHACLFGLDFSSDRILLKDAGFNSLYMSPLLERIWGHGFCSIGSVTRASARYVASYILKKFSGDDAREEYMRYDSKTGEVWEVRPPYVTMSRRPGIGSDWFDEFKEDVFPVDEVVFDGKRFRPPRFYDNRLPEEELEEIKWKREDWMIKRNFTERQLADMEAVAKRREEFFKRNV